MPPANSLKSLTIWPAYAGFEEDLKGPITAGKLADFTVLSADIMKEPETLITIIGGRIVYEAK